MLDLNFIRNNAEKVKKGILDKRESGHVDELLDIDAKRRALLFECEQKRNKLNKTSKEISELKKRKQDASNLISEMKLVSQEIKDDEQKLRIIGEDLNKIAICIPNMPADDVPVGSDSSENIEIKRWGKRKEFSFTPKPHWELGGALDILDFERGSKIAGAGFVLYKGLGARLERSLFNFMLDLHTGKHGYKEIFPPFLVNRQSMFGTGQIPKLEDDMYKIKDEDMFLIPTAEVPVTNIHRDEILQYDCLPICYTAFTACFRREAGAHGKDTRGMTRVHQFNKVELVKFADPETSYEELESLLEDAEEVLRLLGLEYRILELCTGDLSFASSKCYDIEVWSPGTGNYLEVSSCSNFEDFQARRANIRFKDKKGKVKFVHTLNGSGLALPRTMIALLETYQMEDGSIEIPEVLRGYMGGLEIIGKG
ncbi:MAG: serine--tRNA ligase [Candidatus Anammoxibacter sp.]